MAPMTRPSEPREPELPLDRILAGPPRGSSRPVLAASAEGMWLVKLRGAAQGAGALVAEIVVGELAAALGLPVLPRRIVTLTARTRIEDRNDELADLLAASAGANLAFRWIPEARDGSAEDARLLSRREQAATLWLDRFVMNPDRTAANPNLLRHGRRLWLIDHGSALRFQYDWSVVTESAPRSPVTHAEPHLFEPLADAAEWPEVDRVCAERVTRACLERALASVPAAFLQPMLPTDATARDLARRKAAYVAYLWKRLRAPRSFANEPPILLDGEGRGRRPPWLDRA